MEQKKSNRKDLNNEDDDSYMRKIEKEIKSKLVFSYGQEKEEAKDKDNQQENENSNEENEPEEESEKTKDIKLFMIVSTIPKFM